MSTTELNRRPPTLSKLPECDGCGYSPMRISEQRAEQLADAGYERPYIEVEFGLANEGRALLCPVCGTVVRRTD